MRIALVILTRNERPCVEKVMPLVPLNHPTKAYDNVVVVDGGSTDGTAEWFRERGIEVLEQSQRGRGQAFQIAFSQIEADAYIFFSPDGNESVQDLVRFRPLLEQGNDLVIASRMMAGSRNEEDDQYFKWRKWANNGFNLMANLLCRQTGAYVTDSINGYRAITRSAAQRLRLDAEDYTIEYQMTMRAMHAGLTIVEFPTIEGQRVAGETQAKSIPTGIRFLKCLWREGVARKAKTL